MKFDLLLTILQYSCSYIDNTNKRQDILQKSVNNNLQIFRNSVSLTNTTYKTQSGCGIVFNPPQNTAASIGLDYNDSDYDSLFTNYHDNLVDDFQLRSESPIKDLKNSFCIPLQRETTAKESMSCRSYRKSCNLRFKSNIQGNKHKLAGNLMLQDHKQASNFVKRPRSNPNDSLKPSSLHPENQFLTLTPNQILKPPTIVEDSCTELSNLISEPKPSLINDQKCSIKNISDNIVLDMPLSHANHNRITNNRIKISYKGTELNIQKTKVANLIKNHNLKDLITSNYTIQPVKSSKYQVSKYFSKPNPFENRILQKPWREISKNNAANTADSYNLLWKFNDILNIGTDSTHKEYCSLSKGRKSIRFTILESTYNRKAENIICSIFIKVHKISFAHHNPYHVDISKNHILQDFTKFINRLREMFVNRSEKNIFWYGETWLLVSIYSNRYLISDQSQLHNSMKEIIKNILFFHNFRSEKFLENMKMFRNKKKCFEDKTIFFLNNVVLDIAEKRKKTLLSKIEATTLLDYFDKFKIFDGEDFLGDYKTKFDLINKNLENIQKLCSKIGFLTSTILFNKDEIKSKFEIEVLLAIAFCNHLLKQDNFTEFKDRIKRIVQFYDVWFVCNINRYLKSNIQRYHSIYSFLEMELKRVLKDFYTFCKYRKVLSYKSFLENSYQKNYLVPEEFLKYAQHITELKLTINILFELIIKQKTQIEIYCECLKEYVEERGWGNKK